MTFQSLRAVLATKTRLETDLSAAQKQIEVQAAKLRAAEHDARIDPLTHIPNRRAFDKHMEGVQSLFERQEIAYSLVVLDLDNFKSVNDNFGHAAGDSVLQVAAKLLQSQLRLSDRVFRFGGEEFVLVLVATGLRQAMIVAERARKRIEASVVYYDGQELRVTASAGVAEAGRGDSCSNLLEQADAALYSAKRAGRNRVEAARQPQCAADAADSHSGDLQRMGLD
jgi:diguanylate cyclase (GGDEF)-like protein